MSAWTIPGRIASTATPLAMSLVLHALLYASLLLMPSWPWSAGTGLTAELVPPEAPAPQLSPPRPLRHPVPRPAEPSAPPLAVARSRPSVPPAAPSVRAEPTAAEPQREPPSALRPTVAASPSPADGMAPGPGPGLAPTVTEESGAALAPSTASNASAEASPGVPSAVPNVAALPPGEPSRSAIPRGGYQVTPTYPATARRLGLEGTALLGVLVDAKGRVGEVVVRRSAGHPDLDRAAADAIKQWQFEPARRGKEAIAMWVEVPVHFRLR